MVTGLRHGLEAWALATTAALAGCHEGAPHRGPGPTEVCNFLDDDGDGEVDEGFDWTMDGWQVILETDTFATYPRAITLQDGRVALAGADSYGGGADRGFLMLLEADGVPSMGPLWQPIENNGVGGVSVAQDSNGVLFATYGTSDYAGCTLGCPGQAVLASAELERLDARKLPYGFPLRRVHDIGAVPDGYVTLTTDSRLQLTHVSWLELDPMRITTDIELPTTPTDEGSLAVSSFGVAWARTRTVEGNPLDVGIFALDGSETRLGPTLIARPTSGYVQHGRFIAWAGEELFVAWPAQHADDPTEQETLVALVTPSGALRVAPRPIEEIEGAPLDVAIVDGAPIVLTMDNRIGRFAVHRLSRDLRSVTGPGGPLRSWNGGYLTMTPTERGLLLVKGFDSASSQREFRSTLLHCP